MILKKFYDFPNVKFTCFQNFYPAQYSVLDWVSIWHVSQSVSQGVSNHFSPHPPPYIELSFSSSICWYIYSPQTTQIQALEEGSARTCVGGAP